MPDFALIIKEVEAAHPPRAAGWEWLEQSWREPAPFWADLAQFHAAATSMPPKAQDGTGYDFYHDLVLRHLSSGWTRPSAATERAALRWFERPVGWRTLSYAELHVRATRKASQWAAQGVRAGAVLCLVLRPGAEFLVALAAALRLGVCLSVLPPLGPRYLTSRLSALAPAHIDTEPLWRPLLKGFEPLILHEPDAPPAVDGSHTYAVGAPVGMLFSPLHDPPQAPVPLPSEAAYRGALRDGLLVFGLRPGDHLAAPGCHPLQHHPGLLLSTLLAGATFLHLEMEDLAQDPALLQRFPIRCLGITPALRDLLATAPPRLLQGVGHWFRDPLEPLDCEAWTALVKRQGLEQCPAANVVYDAASGGAVLFSSRRRGEIHGEVLPAPGDPFVLLDPNGSGQEAVRDCGVFSPQQQGEVQPGYILLGKGHGRFVYAGTLNPRRSGRVYPRAEVSQVLSGLSYVCGAAVISLPAGGMVGRWLFVLLVFTGSEDEAVAVREVPQRTDEIRRLISAQLGAEFLPDRIEFFPLYPRAGKEGVDDRWCQAQYLTGALFRKSRQRTFQLLTRLRSIGLQGAARDLLKNDRTEAVLNTERAGAGDHENVQLRERVPAAQLPGGAEGPHPAAQEPPQDSLQIRQSGAGSYSIYKG